MADFCSGDLQMPIHQSVTKRYTWHDMTWFITSQVIDTIQKLETADVEHLYMATRGLWVEFELLNVNCSCSKYSYQGEKTVWLDKLGLVQCPLLRFRESTQAGFRRNCHNKLNKSEIGKTTFAGNPDQVRNRLIEIEKARELGGDCLWTVRHRS